VALTRPRITVVPVTAKLSRTFYERVRDDTVEELVRWFNAVDATYRAGRRDSSKPVRVSDPFNDRAAGRSGWRCERLTAA
jgi:hypothetical protein